MKLRFTADVGPIRGGRSPQRRSAQGAPALAVFPLFPENVSDLRYCSKTAVMETAELGETVLMRVQ